jgi:hypothetical protein
MLYSGCKWQRAVVYTKKQMLVGVYLDRGRVSDTPESAETVISETPK